MALKATIFKAELQISDMDRHYYETHMLTIARHPSETDERMMARILAFALNAHEQLQFTKGLSSDEEPDLWQRNYSDEIELWIELGQPDEKRIRKACHSSKQALIYTYQGNSADVWWDKIKNQLTRFKNLGVIAIADDSIEALTQMAERSMRLQCTIQDGQVWLGNADGMTEVKMNIRCEAS